MLVIRPVTSQDIRGVEHCAFTAGLGLTHLPKDSNLLKEKIGISIDSFAKNVTAPGPEEYLFVLSDSDSKAIGGTCGIYAQTGVHSPFFVFRIQDGAFTLKSYQNGPSEVGSLYLLPEYRQGGMGRLLSLSRFLFIATHLERFESTILANMRGVIENNRSIFWEGVNHPLLDVEFNKAMINRAAYEPLLLKALSHKPIKLADLPAEVQKVVGETHPHTKPAINMLLQEGFSQTQEIDWVDGGPILMAETAKLRTVQHNRVAAICEIGTLEAGSDYIVCNNRLNFRACYANLSCHADGSVTLSAEVAKALEVQPGDFIRYIDSPQRH